MDKLLAVNNGKWIMDAGLVLALICLIVFITRTYTVKSPFDEETKSCMAFDSKNIPVYDSAVGIEDMSALTERIDLRFRELDTAGVGRQIDFHAWQQCINAADWITGIWIDELHRVADYVISQDNIRLHVKRRRLASILDGNSKLKWGIWLYRYPAYRDQTDPRSLIEPRGSNASIETSPTNLRLGIGRPSRYSHSSTLLLHFDKRIVGRILGSLSRAGSCIGSLPGNIALPPQEIVRGQIRNKYQGRENRNSNFPMCGRWSVVHGVFWLFVGTIGSCYGFFLLVCRRSFAGLLFLNPVPFIVWHAMMFLFPVNNVVKCTQ